MPKPSGYSAYDSPLIPSGQSWPRVSQILGLLAKPALIPWAARMEREAAIAAAIQTLKRPDAPAWDRETFVAHLTAAIASQRAAQASTAKAADIGRRVHAQIEADLRAELTGAPAVALDLTDAGDTAYLWWLDWRSQVRFVPKHTELVVVNPQWEYGGTIDILGEVDGQLTIVDVKTSNRLYLEAELQITAYRHALMVEHHVPAAQALLIRLPKVATDPGPELRPVPDADGRCWKIFTHLRELFSLTANGLES
jgi:hypothetical protein